MRKPNYYERECEECHRFIKCAGRRCSQCRSRGNVEYKRQWNAKHAEYRRAWQRAYNAKHSDRYKAKHRERRYGLTQEAYDALWSSQGGLCPLGWHPIVKPVVDHDHETGKVRGILCNTCNRGLGMLATEENLRAAADYLKKHAGRSVAA